MDLLQRTTSYITPGDDVLLKGAKLYEKCSEKYRRVCFQVNLKRQRLSNAKIWVFKFPNYEDGNFLLSIS